MVTRRAFPAGRAILIGRPVFRRANMSSPIPGLVGRADASDQNRGLDIHAESRATHREEMELG